MYLSSISYNVNGVAVPEYPLLETHLTRIYPRWLLIKDNITMCRYFANKLPFCNVISRNWALTKGDENVYAMLSPTQWLNARISEASDNVWLYTANEAGVNIKWDIELMKLILNRGLKNVRVVFSNPSVGTPAIAEWATPEKKEWFQLLDTNRSQFVLGIHEYFAGIAPSGFIGGYPDGTWNDGRVNLHPNYEDRSKWPIDPLSIGQLWHCGRLMSINAAARSFGCIPPRIVITEHGIDDLGDMHGWFDKLPKTNGKTLRGWKTWKEALARLLPGKSLDAAYFESVSYLDNRLYSRFPNVEAQLLYSWTSSPDWLDFDLSGALEFQSMLETYVAQKSGSTNPPPIPEPIPSDSIMISLPKLLEIRNAMQMNADITGRLGLQLATIRDDISADLKDLDALIESGKRSKGV